METTADILASLVVFIALQKCNTSPSHIEAEMHDVAVLHHVVGAFEAHFARVFGALFAAAGDVDR